MGGLPTNLGDFITFGFGLPKTGLELRASYKYFVRPSGFGDGHGVLPDVEVPASRALQWVLSHARWLEPTQQNEVISAKSDYCNV